MTLPLRRKRPITQLSSKALRAISAAGGALALLTALGAATSFAGDLQWRRAGAPAAKAGETLAKTQAVLAATVEEPGRSVVVRRPAAPTAKSEAFDPFDASLTENDAAMPVVDPRPEIKPEFDPFEAADEAAANTPANENEPAEVETADQAPGESATSVGIEDAFEEPQAEQTEMVSQPPTTPEELQQAQEAIDREIMRREAEAGAADEMAAPESAESAEQEGEEPAPKMEDELAGPAPDAEPMQGESSDEDDMDLELQYGPEDATPQELTPEQQEARRKALEQERILHEQECQQLYGAVRADAIRNISLDIRLQGTAGEDYPLECSGRHPQFVPRAWSPTTYLWKASGLCHKPLYFEQVQLERYGHDWGPALQPLVSGAHFFGTVPILPYKMGLQTPQECVYTLGYYRPGSCAPYMIQPLGFTWRAAAFEAAAWTGGAAAIP